MHQPEASVWLCRKNGGYSKGTLSLYSPTVKALSCPSIKVIPQTSTYKVVTKGCTYGISGSF